MQGISLLLNELSNYLNVDNVLKFDVFVVIDLSYCITLFLLDQSSLGDMLYFLFSDGWNHHKGFLLVYCSFLSLQHCHNFIMDYNDIS